MSETSNGLKIALLTDGLHPLVMGGMQKHSYYLLRSLVQQNVSVLVYHPGGEGRLKDHLPEKASLLVEEVEIKFPEGLSLPGGYLKRSYVYSLAIADNLHARSDIDFIYAQGFCGWAIANQKKKGSQWPPMGVNFHGLEMFQYAVGIKQKLIQRMFRPPVRFNIKNANRAYSLGGRLTQILSDIIPAKQIASIPIAVEESWLKKESKNFDDQELQVLFIGRYERRKGIEELNSQITSMPVDGVEYHFVGPIAASKKIKASHVTYYGRVVDTEALQEIIDSCHVLVVPSYSEGMPTVILEGMSRGLLILATDVGAVAEQVDNTNGVLLDDNSPNSIAKGLKYLRNLSLNQKEQMSRTSVQRVKEKFLWSKVIQRTLVDIKSLIRTSY